jgi:hypothetical protein
MGWCTIGNTTFQVNSPDECNGTYSSTPPDAGGGGGGGGSFCFIKTIMTRSLGQNILDLGTTYDAQIAFRDDVLNGSPIGRRFVRLYYRHNPSALKLVAANPTLLGQAIHTWFIIAPFVGAVVAASSSNGGGRAGQNSRMRFNRAIHGRVVRLLRALRAESGNPGLKRALLDVEAELRHYVGLTPEEALATIKRRPRRPARPSRRRR